MDRDMDRTRAGTRTWKRAGTQTETGTTTADESRLSVGFEDIESIKSLIALKMVNLRDEEEIITYIWQVSKRSCDNLASNVQKVRSFVMSYDRIMIGRAL
jgi:hypothetical protein